MTAEQLRLDPAERVPPKSGLLSATYAGLSGLAGRIETLDKAIADIGEAGDRAIDIAAQRMRKRLREFEPSVTMIGQVKAGKTSLVNAMIGWPGLLPADVNPWTSVVTSIHMDPRQKAAGNSARFRFFSEEEWDRLLERGGRVGELARRAGAEQEIEKVRQQLEEMREKSRRRLGRKFEMLLGQEHDYGYFDEELVQRYVCLGDDFDASPEDRQGRFADITKAADLQFGQPELPMKLCIRDTPGVNDTFMIREQITIHAIRESRICVVVLSAHQALSSVDMALIRLISNIKSREVIVFVNRIDELADPAKEVPEIRDSIRATLQAHGGPAEAEILFGSAYWANHALSGRYDGLKGASGEALLNWAQSEVSADNADSSVDSMIWTLSGLPALGKAIAERVESGPGAELESKMARSARNLANGLTASRSVVSRGKDGAAGAPIDPARIGAEIDRIETERLEELRGRLDAALGEFRERAASTHRTFLERAVASLIQHLEKHGEKKVWIYEPSGLRLLLRSGYRVYARAASKIGEDVFYRTTSEICDLYLRAFSIPEKSFALEAPPVPPAPAPVLLGQTIALDLKGNWWTRWWRRRRSYASFAREFTDLIQAETLPVVQALETDHAAAYARGLEAALAEFLSNQRAVLMDLAERADLDAGDLRAQLGGSQQRWDTLKSTLSVLAAFDTT